MREVLSKVRTILGKKGYRVLRSLGTIFRKFDSFNGDNLINRNEFHVGLKELGVHLKRGESDVYNYL